MVQKKEGANSIKIANGLLSRFSGLPDCDQAHNRNRTYAIAILALAPKLVLSECYSLNELLNQESANRPIESQLSALRCMSYSRALERFFDDETQREIYESFVMMANSIAALNVGKTKSQFEEILDHLLRVISMTLRSSDSWKIFLDLREIISWSQMERNVENAIKICNRQRMFVLSKDEFNSIAKRFPGLAISTKAWHIETVLAQSQLSKPLAR